MYCLSAYKCLVGISKASFATATMRRSDPAFLSLIDQLIVKSILVFTINQQIPELLIF